jgi:sRNA-binding protein
MDMASEFQIDRDRGKKDARQQLAGLRERWPLAFPANPQDIRPLAIGAAREIATAMGWSIPYTLGVLSRWKMAPDYCEAVLAYDRRIGLDGAPAEEVSAEAKELASKQLARRAAKKTAGASVPSEVTPEAAAAPRRETTPLTPEQLRARVRAGLLRRSA